jgi:hypothetical protein
MNVFTSILGDLFVVVPLPAAAEEDPFVLVVVVEGMTGTADMICDPETIERVNERERRGSDWSGTVVWPCVISQIYI